MNQLLDSHSDVLFFWLKDVAYPLWSTKGFDQLSGLFHENLDRAYQPINGARRSMVQARQIYVMTAMIEMGLDESGELKKRVAQSLAKYIQVYQRDSGAFAFAVGDDLKRAAGEDLYAQAFALFALARGYALLNDPALETSAKKLLSYLMTERKLAAGGFSEIENGATVCRSNPHMHLFESAIEWLSVSKDRAWRDLSALLHKHFEDKILSDRKMIAEEFDRDWMPVLNSDGVYFFEPGHHYEWAWLLARYRDISGTEVGSLPAELYAVANQQGLEKATDFVLDQIWSNGKVKSASSRFWPQAERMKAASYLARHSGDEDAVSGYVNDCLRSAVNLTEYLRPLEAGLWNDSRDSEGHIKEGAGKASSLYHITGAIVELKALKDHR